MDCRGSARAGGSRSRPVRDWASVNAPRRVKGVDSKNVRKHANDVPRLSPLLAPDVRIEGAPRIEQDLNRFLEGIEADRSNDPKSQGINSSPAEMTERIAQAYGLNRRRETKRARKST